MRIRTRGLVVLVVIGLGLVIGAQTTPGETTSTSRPPGTPYPDVYFLIPTTASISISTLNGTTSLTVAQIAGNLSDLPPIVNVSVVQKDIVTFDVPVRGYYSVMFLTSEGTPAAVTYTLTEAGQPPDLTYFGIGILSLGLIGMALAFVIGKRLHGHALTTPIEVQNSISALGHAGR